MPHDEVQQSKEERRPLVAVGYGPRCVPIMQLTEAAADVCELLWMIDGSLPEMRQMTELLNRFGRPLDCPVRLHPSPALVVGLHRVAPVDVRLR